jgi:capsid assembly protease
MVSATLGFVVRDCFSGAEHQVCEGWQTAFHLHGDSLYSCRQRLQASCFSAGGRAMKISSGSFLQFLAEPLCLHESVLQQMFAQHVQQMKGQRVQKPEENASAYDDDRLPKIDDLIVTDGVAVLPIHGVMIKRTQMWDGWFSSRIIVGSDHWSVIIGDLINRTDIETLVFDFDTGGGQVAGTERLGDAIWNARTAGKKTIAVCNEFCASAGLWAATQCEQVVIPATGSIGSLGVYTIHMDDTKGWEKWGMEKTVIHRGKYKGVDERKLTAEAKADLQRFIDGKYSLFVDAVARGRGLSAQEVTQRWGESQLFTGSEAVSNGLADEIGTLQDVLESLRAGRGGRVSIEVPPADTDPVTEPEGENAMLKVNMTGQILDASGKAVGNVAELQIDAAGLTKYFAAQSGELIDSAVKSAKEAAELSHKAALAEHDKARVGQLEALVAAVGPEKGVAAFKARKSVVEAKAETADDLAAQLAAKDKELAELKAGKGTNASTVAPKFLATDSGTQGNATKPAGDNASDPDAEFAAEYEKSGEGFPNLKAFAAYKRYEARHAAK